MGVVAPGEKKCSNDNSVINNNCERIQNLILLFKIPMGRQKYFFEIYRQIGHTASRRVAGPALEFLQKFNISTFLQEILVICYLKI